MKNLLFFGLFFIGVLIFSIVINRILLKFSKTLGIREQADIIRWATTSKPSLGGISFFIAFLLSISVASIFLGEQMTNFKTIGLLTACTMGFIMGLADDAYNTNPLLKFIVQFGCGIILIFSGTYIEFFSNDILNYILTLFWVVGIMNSVNMLDNMDGITTIVSLFILTIATFIIYTQNEVFSLNVNFILLVGVIASLIGFLFYNWNPAKMYMGDTGSQFLGVLLAAIAIQYFWNYDASETVSANSKQVVITILAFIIPIVDTTTVTINRLLKKQSPFVGGRDHTTHHLAYLGFHERQIAVIYAFLCLMSFSMIYYIVNYIEAWSLVHTILFSGYAFIVFVLLYVNTKISKPGNKFKKARFKVKKRFN